MGGRVGKDHYNKTTNSQVRTQEVIRHNLRFFGEFGQHYGEREIFFLDGIHMLFLFLLLTFYGNEKEGKAFQNPCFCYEPEIIFLKAL